MKLIDLFERFSFTPAEKLTEEEIVMWCKSNASEYLSNPTPIYRGDGYGRDAIYHTKDFDRVSKNTLNYYTLWMDNHPQWNAYPKRSKSLIATTSQDTAAGYHQKIFRVIPSDSCKIGVVPAPDLWYAFGPLRSFFRNAGIAGHRNKSMDEMVSSLHHILALMLNIGEDDDQDYAAGRSPLEQSWPKLKAALEEITTDLILDSVSEHRGDWENEKLRALTILARKMNKVGHDTLYDTLDAMMDPKLNHFEVVGPGQIPKNPDSELWIGGGDVMVIRDHSINEDIFKELGLA